MSLYKGTGKRERRFDLNGLYSYSRPVFSGTPSILPMKNRKSTAGYFPIAATAAAACCCASCAWTYLLTVNVIAKLKLMRDRNPTRKRRNDEAIMMANYTIMN